MTVKELIQQLQIAVEQNGEDIEVVLEDVQNGYQHDITHVETTEDKMDDKPVIALKYMEG